MFIFIHKGHLGTFFLIKFVHFSWVTKIHFQEEIKIRLEMYIKFCEIYTVSLLKVKIRIKNKW